MNFEKKINSITNENNKHNNVYGDEILNMFLGEKIDSNKFGDLLINRYFLDLSSLSAEEQFQLLKDRSLYILPEDDLLNKLKKSKDENSKLKIKFGIDPTGSQVHMGHAVPMVLLNRLQRMGHDVVFIIGDFTAKIGDPTGRTSSRPPLNDEQIKTNLLTYKDQVAPFFDMSKANVLYNGERLREIKLDNLIKTLSKISVSSILQRDDFRTRLDDGKGLSMSEILYPIVMGMDSVELKKRGGCDIELGGKDQFLNMQVCRKLMEINGQEQEAIISTDILEGIGGDGKKMSKSLNNYIALNDSPEDIYGKIMSIPDKLLEIYYKSLTEISNIEWKEINNSIINNQFHPMDAKKSLAKILITIMYDKKSAQKAEEQFNNKFSEKNYWNMEIPYYTLEEISIVDYLSSKLKKSKSDIRRLIDAGAVSIIFENNQKEKISKDDSNLSFGKFLTNSNEIIIKIGKKDLLKIRNI